MNDDFFREKLIVSYLSSLAKKEEREQFERFYPSILNFIKETVLNSDDFDLLEKLRDIIVFKERNLKEKIEVIK